MDHVQRYAGRHVGDRPLSPALDRNEYGLHVFESNGVTTAVSSGLRHLDDGAPFGEELVCSLHSCMRACAESVVSAVCEVVVRRGKGLEYGDVVELPNGGGVVASLHLCFEAEINYRLRPEVTTVGEGMVDFQLVSLIPATANEMRYASKFGGQALVDVLRIRRADVLDIGRASAL